jgi:alpha-L-fucosidase
MKSIIYNDKCLFHKRNIINLDNKTKYYLKITKQYDLLDIKQKKYIDEFCNINNDDFQNYIEKWISQSTKIKEELEKYNEYLKSKK